MIKVKWDQDGFIKIPTMEELDDISYAYHEEVDVVKLLVSITMAIYELRERILELEQEKQKCPE